MLSLLTPHLRLTSVLELEVGHVHALGLRGLLLDLDCTLKDYHAAEVGPRVSAWLRALRSADIRLCLLSNGTSKRIERVAQRLDIPFVAKAFKPLPWGCRAALQKLSLDAGRVGVIGDQLFADVLAGRLAGLFTILVQPTSPEEPWFTRLKRPLERWVLRRTQTPVLNSATAVGAHSCSGGGTNGCSPYRFPD